MRLFDISHLHTAEPVHGIFTNHFPLKGKEVGVSTVLKLCNWNVLKK